MSDTDPATPSTRPYLVRALHEWCTENGFSPYMAVFVDESVQVPADYVVNGEIVLNVSYDATSGLQLGNDYITFKARFGGIPHDVMIPASHVLAIYAKENGQGMGFPPPEQPATVPVPPIEPDDAAGVSKVTPLRAVPSMAQDEAEESSATDDDGGDDVPPPPPTNGRPALKRVK